MRSAPLRAAVPPTSKPADNDLLHDTVSGLLRACDIVFGTIATALTLFGTWLFIMSELRALTVLALWFFPVFNTTWSAVTRRRDRATADLIRAAIAWPASQFLYVAEVGVLEKLWIPALIMPVGIALSLGITLRRAALGHAVTFAYAAGLLGVATLHAGRFEMAALYHALGILLTGGIIAMVAARLGHTLEEARRQRDGAREQKDRAEAALQQLTQRSHELTTAIQNLHDEMQHRMRVEVELRQVHKLESVGRLAAGVAHEINTPVQFVSDSLQFIRNGVTDLFDVVHKLEAVQRSVLDGAPSREAASLAADASDTADLPYLAENVPRALDRALDGLGRVTTIVRSMKVFAHPDSTDMEIADLNQAIQSTLTMAHSEYRHLAEVDTEFGELPPVRCYVGELNQAVLNLVVNAAQAIEDVVHDTGTRGRITVRTQRDGDDAVISIADTGSGIPEAIRDRIFDPFFTTKQVGRGTGQGLAIVRSVVVDKHHGRLTFETELGKGTRFHVRLPIEGTAHPSDQRGGCGAGTGLQMNG
jgi:signal transduction histidine kinase